MIKNEQKGFVSIIVAATIMIILALVTIGFTRYVQREQRQALDRQLSKQALYVAESGINETFKELLENNTIPDEKTDCDPDAIVGSGNSVIDSANQIEYTCILYDKNPTRLDYTVNNNSSKVIQIATSTGNSFETIDVSWGNADSTNNTITNLPPCSDAGDFPVSRQSTIPLLKIDLTNIGLLNRSDLLTNTDYLYLSPCNGGTGGVTSYSYNKSQKGNVVGVECSGTESTPCFVSINISSENSGIFMTRLKPIYASANIVLRGNERTSSAPITTDDVEFAGQYSIDVTARASDIVRRLRAAIPLNSVDKKPEAVLQTFNDICKLLELDRENNSITDTCP